MDNYINELKRIAKWKKVPLSKLAESIGMSVSGFHQSIRYKTLTFDKLLKICKVLDIEPIELFKDEPTGASEPDPIYGKSDSEILKEVLKTVKRIESQLNSKK